MEGNVFDYIIVYLYLIFGTTSLIFSGLWMVFTLLIKELRSPPGWLLFWQNTCQIMIDFSGVYSAFHYLMFREFLSDSESCKITGAFFIIFYFFGFSYITWLTIEIWFKIKNPFDNRYKYRSIGYHLYSQITAIAMGIFAYSTDATGLSVINICCLKNVYVTNTIWFCFVAINLFVSILFVIWSLHLVKNIQRQRATFLYRSIGVVVAFYALLFPLIIRLFIIDDDAALNADSVIISFFVATMGMVMAHFRLNERIVRQKVIKLFKQNAVFSRGSSMSTTSLTTNPVSDMDKFFAGIFEDLVGMVFTSLHIFYSHKANDQEGSAFVADEYMFKRELHYEDFVEIDSNFSQYQKYGITLTEYAPLVFESIRDLDKLSQVVMRYSLDPALNFGSRSLAKGGNSGAFLFFTHDNRFLLKTITQEEMIKLFRERFLEKLHKHIMEPGEESLIARIYGLYKLKIQGRDPAYFVIMQNVLEENPNFKFDLKGSEVNRRVGSMDMGSIHLSNVIFKDLDYKENIGSSPINNKKYVMNIMRRDVIFLSRHNLMDYSLILGVYGNDVFTYQLGIIDYLQVYNKRKQLETTLKKRLTKGKEISCEPPEVYGPRFLSFMESAFSDYNSGDITGHKNSLYFDFEIAGVAKDEKEIEIRELVNTHNTENDNK